MFALCGESAGTRPCEGGRRRNARLAGEEPPGSEVRRQPVKDDREFVDGDGRRWRVTLRAPAGAGPAAEGAKLPSGYLALRFQSGKEVRIASARDDWDQLPDERLRDVLATEAMPESEWLRKTPTTSDDEGLHGLSDAPGG